MSRQHYYEEEENDSYSYREDDSGASSSEEEELRLYGQEPTFPCNVCHDWFKPGTACWDRLFGVAGGQPGWPMAPNTSQRPNPIVNSSGSSKSELFTFAVPFCGAGAVEIVSNRWGQAAILR